MVLQLGTWIPCHWPQFEPTYCANALLLTNPFLHSTIHIVFNKTYLTHLGLAPFISVVITEHFGTESLELKYLHATLSACITILETHFFWANSPLWPKLSSSISNSSMSSLNWPRYLLTVRSPQQPLGLLSITWSTKPWILYGWTGEMQIFSPSMLPHVLPACISLLHVYCSPSHQIG